MKSKCCNSPMTNHPKNGTVYCNDCGREHAPTSKPESYEKVAREFAKKHVEGGCCCEVIRSLERRGRCAYCLLELDFIEQLTLAHKQGYEEGIEESAKVADKVEETAIDICQHEPIGDAIRKLKSK